MELTYCTQIDGRVAGRATTLKKELDDLLTAVGATRDGQAFAVLFDHFRPRVQAQLVRLGLGPAAAEDLTQDVMETIWQKAHLYDRNRSAAITWVFQIARNRQLYAEANGRRSPKGAAQRGFGRCNEVANGVGAHSGTWRVQGREGWH